MKILEYKVIILPFKIEAASTGLRGILSLIPDSFRTDVCDNHLRVWTVVAPLFRRQTFLSFSPFRPKTWNVIILTGGRRGRLGRRGARVKPSSFRRSDAGSFRTGFFNQNSGSLHERSRFSTLSKGFSFNFDPSRKGISKYGNLNRFEDVFDTWY